MSSPPQIFFWVHQTRLNVYLIRKKNTYTVMSVASHNHFLSPYFSATVSGIVENIIVYPLDVYKIVRQQEHMSLGKFLRTPLEFKYRGFLYRLYGNIPMRVIFWTSQDTYSTMWDEIIQKNMSFTPWKRRQTSFPWHCQKIVFVSAFTGLNQTIVDAPIENLKIHQIQYGHQTPLRLDLPRLYKGFTFHYCRNSIFIGGVYGCNFFAMHPDNTIKISPLFSGMIGGMMGCLLSQPFDYLKTLRQSDIPIRFQDILTPGFHRDSCFIGGFPRLLAATVGMGIGSYVYYLVQRFQ